MNSLSFNDKKFHPVIQNDDQIWITSSELAEMLGYTRSDKVTQIFNRRSDEFTQNMTRVIENPQTVNLVVRIFSLRGAHLIAVFARTSVAKEFRKWVLDMLDKEVGQPVSKTHKSEREPLTNAVNMLVAKTKHLNYSDAYKLVHQRFNVEHIEDIPYDTIPIAVEYVHHLIALFGNKDRKASDMNTIALAYSMLWCRQWWKEYGDAIRKISPNIASAVHDHFVDGAFVAWMFVDETERAALRKKLESHQWNLTINERLRLI